jgi:hypothetical protein
MVYLPVSDATVGAARRPSRLAAFAALVADTFATLGAATRVARAVEANREAAPADLKRLGIRGPLPRVR